jgi:hypothetical protein
VDYKQIENLITEQINLQETTAKKAELNEMLLAIYLAEDAKLDRVEGLTGDLDAAVFSLKKEYKISDEEFDNESERAWAMADAAIEWASNNEYGSRPTRVVWTARKGSLEKSIKQPSSPGNPTDVLLEFGKDNWLGISAKSTSKGTGAVPFKNPGMPSYAKKSTIEKKQEYLNILEKKYPELKKYPDDISRNALIKSIVSKVERAGRNLVFTWSTKPTPSSQQKKMIEDIYNFGEKIQESIRDMIVDHMTSIPQSNLKIDLRRNWINASKSNFPYFIIVTGRGTQGKYSADVVDPINSPIAKMLSRDDIVIQNSEHNALKIYGVTPTGTERYFFKIRVKWEGRPLASSIKLSGEQ